MVERVANKHPSYPAYEFYNKKTTYADFIQKIEQAARAFTAMGIRRDDRVTICMPNTPQALVCFFEGESYEDVIRNCISIGGDSDTIAAIAGGIAEAYYGVPEEFSSQVRAYMDKGLLRIVDDFSVWSRERSSAFSLASSAIP